MRARGIHIRLTQIFPSFPSSRLTTSITYLIPIAFKRNSINLLYMKETLNTRL